jgi:hypothetical protein
MKTFNQIYVEASKHATLTLGYEGFHGKLIIGTTYREQDRDRWWGSMMYDGGTATLWMGNQQMGKPGKLVIGIEGPTGEAFVLDGTTGDLIVGGPQSKLTLRNRMGKETAVLSAGTSTLTLGHEGTAATGADPNGKLILRAGDGTEPVIVEGAHGNLTLGTTGHDGDLKIRNEQNADIILMSGHTASLVIAEPGGKVTIALDGATAKMALGGNGQDGDIVLKSSAGNDVIKLDANDGLLTLGGPGVNGDIFIRNDNDIDTIKITGRNGDIEFLNADVAEEFEIHSSCLDDACPGSVVVLDDSGSLVPCEQAYDGRVVGIVAGAGAYRPGIVLDKSGGANRRPVAMAGKAYCWVDADVEPVYVGDLLTTSPHRGHAMRASDRARALGCVIGKALRPLACGKDLIPVLVRAC